MKILSLYIILERNNDALEISLQDFFCNTGFQRITNDYKTVNAKFQRT